MLDHDELLRAVRATQFQRRFNLAALRRLLDRRPCKPLRLIVEDLTITHTGIEDRMLKLCDRYGIRPPLTQQWVLSR